MFKRALVATSGVVLVAGLAAPASASAPEIINVSCAGHDVQQVYTNGNGQWTPARGVDSNEVYVPIAFSDFYAVAYEPGTDTVIDEFHEEGSTSKKARQLGRQSVECEWWQSVEDTYDEYLGRNVDATWGGTVVVTLKKA